MRKALCVGIDSYQNIDDLHGCVNDANAVKAALERNGDGTLNFDVKIMCQQVKIHILIGENYVMRWRNYLRAIRK